MKKILLFIIIFAVIAVGTTAGLIRSKNSKDVVKNSGDMNYIVDIEDKENEEKTIDLYGTYSQNDLLIKKQSFQVEGFDEYFSFPQIIGLKDKNIEDKVNKSIVQKLKDMISNFLATNKEFSNFSFVFNEHNYSNFSNVISLSCYLSCKIGENYFYDYIGLNYELVNGEELLLKDIFRNNEDLTTIVRMSIYKYIAEQYREIGMEGFGYSDIYYDADKGAWYGNYTSYDESTWEMKKEKREYTPKITEYDIEKKIKKFNNSNNKIYYFTPAELIMKIDDWYCELDFKDIADKVVIYNKYLTKNSLYERDDIGAKSIITCSAERDLNKYKETKYECDNFFYDISTESYGEDPAEYPSSKYYNKKLADLIKQAKVEVEEYKSIANNNKDKAYFLFAQVRLNPGVEYNYGSRTYNNLFSTNLQTKIFTCDKEDRDRVLNIVLSKYRYNNIGFYGSIYNYIGDTIYLNNNIDNHDSVTELSPEIKNDEHVYNVLNDKEITSVSEIFKDGIDYESVIRNVAKRAIGNNAIYKVSSNSITVFDDGENKDYGLYIGFDEIKDSLNVLELKKELFQSNLIQLERSELESMSKDELYRAYNEIFARYGHDFKVQEYKYYFDLWDWYEPIPGKTVSLDELNDIEKYNVNLIKSLIDEKD